MAPVERTAHPRFKRILSERELAQFFTPDEAEVAWARRRTHARPERVLALLVLLKCCARLGYFPDLADIPASVDERIRGTITIPPDTTVAFPADRSAERHRSWSREYLGLVHDPARAREIAMAAMEEAAPVRGSVVDLVNVALEELVRAGLELSGFSTLDDLFASSIVFSTTIDMTTVLSGMAAKGWTLQASDLAVLSPYRRENVPRFVDYTTDHLHTPLPAYTPTIHSGATEGASSRTSIS